MSLETDNPEFAADPDEFVARGKTFFEQFSSATP